jgi:hypothetical protein
MNKIQKFTDRKFNSINEMHDEAMIEVFRQSIGQKVFILTPSFPFLFIGKIEDVEEDLIILDVETTQIPQLEKKTWLIHIHQIEVFYIESPDGPKIPELKD